MTATLALIFALVALLCVIFGFWLWLERPMICRKCGAPLEEDGFCYDGDEGLAERRQL